MAVIAVLGPILVALGLIVALLMAVAQRRVLGVKLPPPPAEWPPVTILKPLKGKDPDLEKNITSFFTLDYPDYEVILGAAEIDDPALPIAQEIHRSHPEVQSTVLSCSAVVGFNPKVNNLANLYKEARHHLILISDSNIEVTPDYLKNLVAQRHAAGGGLVWSVFKGASWNGFCGGLESLQLNSMVIGGMCAAHVFLRTPCALGKSMLLGRGDLEAIGGFEAFGAYLAEDQLISEELKKIGRPITVSSQVIDNVIGPISGSGFFSRQLRWCRLRRWLNLANYIGEFFLNPIFLALIFLAIGRTWRLAAVAGLAALMMAVIDFSTERRLGVKRRLWTYVPLEIFLGIARGVLWFVPFFSRTVVWRENRFTLGPRSRITPMDAEISQVASLESEPEHAERSRA